MSKGPLEGLRVVDLTDDSGRFATKVLAEMGATVVRVHDGAGVTHGPAMKDPAAAERGGLLDWWYDANKRMVPLDLTSPAGADAYRRLTSRADLVIETMAPGRLAALGLDHADLVGANPALVQVSLTPFGRTGPRAGWVTTDLVTAALGGPLSVCGTPDEAVVAWGRQAFIAASFVAALSGLAAVRDARRCGAGQLVDVSAHEAVASSVEQIWFQYHYDDKLPFPKIAPRQKSLHWSRAYEVLPCKTGYCMITAAPAPMALLDWLVETEEPGAAELASGTDPWEPQFGPKLVALAANMARKHDSGTMFWEAQGRHLAWGEVQTIAQLAHNPQLEYRDAFTASPTVPSVRRTRFPAVFEGTTPDAPDGPVPGTVDELLADWAPRDRSATGPVDGRRPLEGVRVLDMSWVLAGPFCCRLLGDLGADIVKMQTATRIATVNDPEHAFYPVYNRSKRSLALDMKAPGAMEIARKVIENCDVLIENYAAGVLARWGLDWETIHSWNPRLVYVTMSGCGHDGPWSSVVSYGPTVQALSGMTAISNPPGRGDVGAGYALNDMAVGGLAATSIVAGVEARDRTGLGQRVDIAQLEAGGWTIGQALLDLLSNGREAVPTGNTDPYATFVFNDVLKTADGEVAVTVRDDRDLAALRSVVAAGPDGLAAWCAGRTADDAQQALQAVGVPAGRVQNAHLLFTDDPQLAARGFFSSLPSAVFGDRPFERFPAFFSRSVLEPYRPAPTYVGEHNFEVLAEVAGMDDGEVAEAIADGRLA